MKTEAVLICRHPGILMLCLETSGIRPSLRSCLIYSASDEQDKIDAGPGTSGYGIYLAN